MIEEVLKSRRSVRRFKPERPSRECIRQLVEMAATAPSASNKQPWRFFVTENRELIDAMAAAVQAAIDRILKHVEPSYMEAFREYGDYFVRFSEAPVVIVCVYREIVVLSNLVDSGIEAEDLARVRTMEMSSGLASTAMAIENLLLYAHATGLGASCMTGPLVAENNIKQLMSIPDTWNIAAVIAVGYPDEEPQPTTRKAVANVLRWV